MLRHHTPPAPLERGGFGCWGLVGKEWFGVWRFPLLRGDQGVCYGEVRDLAQRVFRGEVPWL